jgi:hypothetical protein
MKATRGSEKKQKKGFGPEMLSRDEQKIEPNNDATFFPFFHYLWSMSGSLPQLLAHHSIALPHNSEIYLTSFFSASLCYLQ